MTLSAAHRASFRRIVENAGSSAYAKSSAFSLGVLGHILRIILLSRDHLRLQFVLPKLQGLFASRNHADGRRRSVDF
jgi:hypothetical protein